MTTRRTIIELPTTNTFDPKPDLFALHARLGGWREVAETIGEYSAGYWCGVSRGTVKLGGRAENILRRRLGLAPRGVSRLSQMTQGDLACYLEHRSEVQHG